MNDFALFRCDIKEFITKLDDEDLGVRSFALEQIEEAMSKHFDELDERVIDPLIKIIHSTDDTWSDHDQYNAASILSDYYVASMLNSSLDPRMTLTVLNLISRHMDKHKLQQMIRSSFPDSRGSTDSGMLSSGR